MNHHKPALFGINNSNRDYTKLETWGKNQFNSSFPASLVAYMFSKNIEPVYLKIDSKNQIVHSKISAKKLFGISPLSPDIFYAFETIFTPYQPFYKGQIPRIDLVIQDLKTGYCAKGIEVKLTALPDNSTCDLSDEEFSCEIVIRPDTISYLACSICSQFKNNRNGLQKYLQFSSTIQNWEDEQEIVSVFSEFVIAIDNIAKAIHENQIPIILQPIWKTNGKSPKLADNCLDTFVWSDLAVIHLFTKFSQTQNISRIGRTERTLIWLIKMLFEFAENGHFNADEIIDKLSFNTRNDKAFAVNGHVTYPLLKCDELTNPRIRKDEIKNIILGGGQNLLSPERRFDAIIYSSTDLFEKL